MLSLPVRKVPVLDPLRDGHLPAEGDTFRLHAGVELLRILDGAGDDVLTTKVTERLGGEAGSAVVGLQTQRQRLTHCLVVVLQQCCICGVVSGVLMFRLSVVVSCLVNLAYHT